MADDGNVEGYWGESMARYVELSGIPREKSSLLCWIWALIRDFYGGKIHAPK